MPYEVTVLLCFLAFALISYLLGSVNFAIITTKIFTGTDVRASGSGNAGMTNVMRTAGFVPGMITFVGDFAKAVIACALGKYALTPVISALVDTAAHDTGLFSITPLTPFIGGSLAAFFCIVGHVYPVFFGFRGGKGIATAAGTMVILDPRIFAIELALFLLLFLCTRIISVGSIAAAVAYPVVAFICFEVFSPIGKLNTAACNMENAPLPVGAVVAAGALLVAILVFFKHMPNLKRLIHGEESKLVLKKKKDA